VIVGNGHESIPLKPLKLVYMPQLAPNVRMFYPVLRVAEPWKVPV
jgi:hypothetical protein